LNARSQGDLWKQVGLDDVNRLRADSASLQNALAENEARQGDLDDANAEVARLSEELAVLRARTGKHRAPEIIFTICSSISAFFVAGTIWFGLGFASYDLTHASILTVNLIFTLLGVISIYRLTTGRLYYISKSGRLYTINPSIVLTVCCSVLLLGLLFFMFLSDNEGRYVWFATEAASEAPVLASIFAFPAIVSGLWMRYSLNKVG
jgi:hypothetical protein